ncbi:type IV pilus twitching motility protein PilT [Clostridium tertium]|uniref:type IV pilus twitching motility protein PilT n=1 Tax=Clostridium tertium TaxID=1559 RepID=UPI0023B2DE77|nr:type IV pilus twitching motility protein PilT [Clostridium tertium]
MESLQALLATTIYQEASDLHLVVGSKPKLRINGVLKEIKLDKLTAADTRAYAEEILGDRYTEYNSLGELDTAYSLPGVGRFRVNVFRQRNSDTVAIRAINSQPPTLTELGQSAIIKKLTQEKKGLIIVTGTTGSGKSTTLAAMINEINHTRADRIITLEDPIEYLHPHKLGLVSQREIGSDSASYENALRAALRQDPDVILIGEMRDLTTMSIALTAAETGHLVFSTLHTIDAASSITRIIDTFPANQQEQVRTQLRVVLKAVISQQLVPTIDNKRACAQEILINTIGISNLIKENKVHQIPSSILTGSAHGMRTMNMSLMDLVRKGTITRDTAYAYSLDKENLKGF